MSSSKILHFGTQVEEDIIHSEKWEILRYNSCVSVSASINKMNIIE